MTPFSMHPISVNEDGTQPGAKYLLKRPAEHTPIPIPASQLRDHLLALGCVWARTADTRRCHICAVAIARGTVVWHYSRWVYCGSDHAAVGLNIEVAE